MQEPRDDPEFNTPREMFMRAMFLLYLLGSGGGLIVVITGVMTGHGRLAVGGLIALAAAWLLRGWLERHGCFAEVRTAFDELTAVGPPLDPAHVSELARLLREWEALERQRGSPRFDPWALQVVRNDIREMIARDPALAGVFRRRPLG